MKKLLPCIACDQQIGMHAIICPHCGEGNGELQRLKNIRVKYFCSFEVAKQKLSEQKE